MTNFHTDFKNLIGFAVATWEIAELAPFFKDSKLLIFKEKTDMNDLQFGRKWNYAFGLSKEHTINIGVIHACVDSWGTTKSLGELLSRMRKLNIYVTLCHNCWYQQKMDALP